MADGLAAVWRSALEANLRYYEAWGRVASEYVRDLGASLKAYSPTVRVPPLSVPLTVTRPDVSGSERSESTGSSPASSDIRGATPPTLVLESDAGRAATGAVLVQNHLSHPVSAAVMARIDGDHPLTIELDPVHVDLAPDESTVVRVTAVIPATGPADLRGELSVPELVGTSVLLLVRRRRPDETGTADPRTG